MVAIGGPVVIATSEAVAEDAQSREIRARPTALASTFMFAIAVLLMGQVRGHCVGHGLAVPNAVITER